MLIRALKLQPLYAPDGEGDEPTPVPAVKDAAPPEDDDLDLPEEELPTVELEADDDEPEDQPQPRVEAPRRKPANDTIRELKEARKAEAERSARLEQELSQYRAERERERAEREARTEEDRLLLMTTEERIDYKLNKAQEENKRLIAQQQFVNADQADRLEFQAKIPERYKAYASEVETKLKEIRETARINVPRDTVLKLVLGEKVLERAATAKPQTRQAPPRRVAPPASGRGDTTGERRRSASLEQRLANQLI
jgi:hypothetical protein